MRKLDYKYLDKVEVKFKDGTYYGLENIEYVYAMIGNSKYYVLKLIGYGFSEFLGTQNLDEWKNFRKSNEWQNKLKEYERIQNNYWLLD